MDIGIQKTVEDIVSTGRGVKEGSMCFDWRELRLMWSWSRTRVGDLGRKLA